MTCQELANDQMLAPTAEVSSHLAGCESCRDRQRAVMLAARALRAMAGESEFPESNARAIREAIPQLAVNAARRRPAAWWQVAAAAAVLLIAVGGGLHWASRKQEAPAGKSVANNTESAKSSAGGVAVPGNPEDTAKPVVPPAPPPDHSVPPNPVKPPDPTPTDPPLPRPPGGAGFVARGPEPPPPPHPHDVPDPVKPPPPPSNRAPRDTAGVADCMQIVKGLLGSGEPVSCDLNGDGVTGVADAMLAARMAAAERRAR